MELPCIDDIDIKGKKVIVRMDVDVDDLDPNNLDLRIKAAKQTLEYLVENGATSVLVGHKGRPEGKEDNKLSLESVSKLISHILREKYGEERMKSVDIQMMENVRFNEGETKNDSEFSRCLAKKGEIYINEAFASSHRKHASIVGVPEILKGNGGEVAFGFRFLEEVKVLSKVREKKRGKSLLLLSGVKEDKLSFAEKLEPMFDKILLSGRLPEYLGDIDKDPNTLATIDNPKLIVGNLNQDKEDITVGTIEIFEKHIANADLVVVSGPPGKFEDEGQRLGTKRVLEAVAHSDAYTIAGGGNTEDALKEFSLSEKLDWVSVGGGAMLEFLTHGTLPGIDALIH